MSKEPKSSQADSEETFSLLKQIFEELMPFDRLLGVKVENFTGINWVSEIIDHGFIHSIYSFDPNNIPIEFSAPVEKLDIRRSPRMADKSPCQNALKGSEPQPGLWPPILYPTPKEQRTIYPGEGTILNKSDFKIKSE